MKRHADIPTIELIQELALRSDVRRMNIESNEMYKIEAMGINKEKSRYIKVDEPTVILIARKNE